MDLRRASRIVLVGLLVVAGACSRGGGSTGETAVADPVTLGYDGPDGLKIGVITSSTGEGSSVRPLAEGARLAEYRLEGLDAGAGRIELVAVDDLGDPEEAVLAVDELAEQGASGIVYVSTGRHVEPALARADELGIPVLLPYAHDGAVVEGLDATWITGVTEQAAARAVNRFTEAAQVETVRVLVTGDGDHPGLVLFDAPVTDLGMGGDETYDAAVGEADLSDVDVVVVWSAAAPSAEVVAALQRAGVGATVMTTTTALRPAFADRLVALQEEEGAAVVDASLLAVGPAVTDFDGTSRVDAFIQALRIASSDPGLTAVDSSVDTLAEAESIGSIDAGAHDAVLLLAAAAADARSLEPDALAASLRSLDPTEVAGRAGPPPEMDRPEGLPDHAVAVLRADAYTGGPRADLGTPPRISWYRVETAG